MVDRPHIMELSGLIHRSRVGDDQRRRRLARNRLLALALLALMAALYVGSFALAPGALWVHVVRAAAEAGIVGGLADWFAVTALFRHPLGLPIPHTAIVPNNKDRIAATLRQFVEQNFLTREILVRKLREAGLAERLLGWLTAPQTAPLLAERLTRLAPRLLAGLESSEAARLIARAARDRLRQAELAPLASRFLAVLMRSGAADEVFEAIARGGAAWLEQNSGRIQEIVEARSRWWVPKAINRRIAKAFIQGIGELLNELCDAGSARRQEFERELRRWVRDLAGSPESAERIRIVTQRVASDPRLRACLARLWRQFSASLLHDIETPSPKTRAAFERALAAFARALANDPAVMAEINAAAERLALTLVVRRHQIAGVVEEVIRRWDAATITDRLELVVGSDLQYIRMNGTLVGASVGGLIFIASWAAGFQ